MPLPTWLDPASEVAKYAEQGDRIAFVLTSMQRLLDYGCSPEQAAGVVANSANESAWGRSIYCGNGFGWKINRAYAQSYLQRTGQPAPWWRARGNIRSGDAPEVYYRVFGTQDAAGAWQFDFGAALGEWMEHFVPRPDQPAPYSGYRKCGALFWSGGAWFPEMIQVGYKGPVTRAHPERSIAAHDTIVRSVLAMWAQSRLGVTVDGKWGRGSATAASEYQRAHQLPVTGQVDSALLISLEQERRSSAHP